jgi:hypothetical protein
LFNSIQIYSNPFKSIQIHSNPFKSIQIRMGPETISLTKFQLSQISSLTVVVVLLLQVPEGRGGE